MTHETINPVIISLVEKHKAGVPLCTYIRPLFPDHKPFFGGKNVHVGNVSVRRR